MSRSIFHARPSLVLAALTLLALAGCTGPQPRAYSGLPSHGRLQPNGGPHAGRTPFAFSEQVDWRSYRQIIIDPVEVYHGPDADFGKIPQRGQDALAHYMHDQFARTLARTYQVVDVAGPDTLHLHLTLTGASVTPPVVGTLTHFDLAGGIYNTVQGVRGKQAMMSGAVVYALDLRDAQSDRLLHAQVTKQYPGAMNIPASFGVLKAAKVGIDKGAKELAAQLMRGDLPGAVEVPPVR
jgi:hypothetical protein